MLLGIGLQMTQLQPLPPAVIPNYYVAKPGGSDSADGLTRETALLNLSALPSLVANDAIGGKFGSTWLQQSVVSAEDGIKLVAYGAAGDGKPTIDAEGVAARCVDLSGDDCILRNFILRGATVNDGCLVMSGRRSLAEDFIAEEGGLHTALIADGTWRRGIVRNGTGASLVEIFDGVGGGKVTLDQVDTTMDSYDVGMAGIDGHTAGGGVTMEKVTINAGLSENLGSAISLSDEILDAEIVGRRLTVCLEGITVRQDAVIKRLVDRDAPAGGSLLTVAAPNVEVVIEELDVIRSLFNTRMMGSNQPGITVRFRGDSVIRADSFSVFAMGFFDYGDVQFGEAGDEIYLDTENIPYAFINGRGDNTATLSTPANYTIPTWSFAVELNGATYSGETAIKAAGLFINATIGDPP